jgi:hypothetical protein
MKISWQAEKVRPSYGGMLKQLLINHYNQQTGVFSFA